MDGGRWRRVLQVRPQGQVKDCEAIGGRFFHELSNQRGNRQGFHYNPEGFCGVEKRADGADVMMEDGFIQEEPRVAFAMGFKGFLLVIDRLHEEILWFGWMRVRVA